MPNTVAKTAWDFVWTNRGWTIRIVIIVAILVFLGIGIRSCYYKTSSSAYWKSSAEYKQEKSDWEKEKAGLKEQIAGRDKRIAEIEPKAIAFDAVATQHKAIDADLAKKVEEVSNDEANKEAAANQSTDCRTRVQRVCDLLRARNPKYDCGPIFKESCPTTGQ